MLGRRAAISASAVCVTRGPGAEPLVLQNAGDEIANIALVIHDQDVMRDEVPSALLLIVPPLRAHRRRQISAASRRHVLLV